MSATLTKPVTAGELLDMPADGYRYELVEGADVVPGFQINVAEIFG